MIQIDERWLTDKSLHDRIRANPEQELRQLGYAEEFLEGKKFVVVTNTKNSCYIAIDTPPSYNNDYDLASIQAAGVGEACIGMSTAACVSTVSTVISICTTASTFSTGGSAGTIGTETA